MREQKLGLSPETQLLIDFLNYNFGRYRKTISKTDVALKGRRRRVRFARFIGACNLNSPEGWKTARVIQNDLRNVLFQYRTDGKRDLGPLTAEINKYADKPVLIPRDDSEGEGVDLLIWDNSGDPRRDLYQIIASALVKQEFWVQECRYEKCKLCYFGKRKFHSTACQRAVNSQTAPDRMKRSRANKRFKQVKPQLIKLRKLAERLRLSEILAAFPEFRRLDPQLLSQIVERKKYLNDLVIKGRNRRILLQTKLPEEGEKA